MYPHENGLLIAGSCFFIFVLCAPGLAGWFYQNYLDRKQTETPSRVIPMSAALGRPS